MDYRAYKQDLAFHVTWTEKIFDMVLFWNILKHFVYCDSAVETSYVRN